MIKEQIALLVLFYLFVCPLVAQQDSSFIVSGRITIADTKEVLPLVNVFNISSQNGVTSNEKGEFELQIDNWPALLQFTFIGYETLALWIDKPQEKWLDIQMHPYFKTLPDVVVSAKPIIETITKPTYTVRDYVFIGDKILIATLPGIKDGNALVLIDEDGNALDSISIKHIRHFDFLHKSCLDKIHLVSRMEHFEILTEGDKIEILKGGTRKEFSRQIEPCVASTDSLMIYRFRYCVGQLLQFKAFDKNSSNDFIMAEVADDDNVGRRFREELAHKIGYIDYLNISWEEKQLELKRTLENDMKLASLIHLFYKPINIPVLNIGAQVMLFNHLKNRIQVYNKSGMELSAIPITFQKEKKWEGDVIFDELAGNVYTLFDHPKGKVIREVYMEDGTLGSPVLIDCAMVESIKVNNGKMYYLESGRGAEAYNRVLRKVKL